MYDSWNYKPLYVGVKFEMSNYKKTLMKLQQKSCFMSAVEKIFWSPWNLVIINKFYTDTSMCSFHVTGLFMSPLKTSEN